MPICPPASGNRQLRFKADKQLRPAKLPASPAPLWHHRSAAKSLCLQDCVSRLIAGVHATVSVNSQLEEALRLIPRSLFLPAEAVSCHLL